MPIDLSSFISASWLVADRCRSRSAGGSVMRLLGHVLHLVIKGCGFVLLG